MFDFLSTILWKKRIQYFYLMWNKMMPVRAEMIFDASEGNGEKKTCLLLQETVNRRGLLLCWNLRVLWRCLPPIALDDFVGRWSRSLDVTYRSTVFGGVSVILRYSTSDLISSLYKPARTFGIVKFWASSPSYVNRGEPEMRVLTGHVVWAVWLTQTYRVAHKNKKQIPSQKHEIFKKKKKCSQ